MEEVDNELLIALVEARPVLWDRNLDVYKDRFATRDAWVEICMELSPVYNELDDSQRTVLMKEITRRWTNIRDAFAKSRKKMQEYDLGIGGIGKKRPKKYVFHNQLKFLVNEEDNFYITLDESEEGIEDESPRVSPGYVEIRNNSRSVGTKRKRGLIERQKLLKRRKPDVYKFKPHITTTEVRKPNPFISFVEGLMPHLEKFDQSEVLQFQIGVLQVISNITEQKRSPQQLFKKNTTSALVQMQSEAMLNSPSCSPTLQSNEETASTEQQSQFEPFTANSTSQQSSLSIAASLRNM